MPCGCARSNFPALFFCAVVQLPWHITQAAEFHAEHEAVHATSLWRRRPAPFAQRGLWTLQPHTEVRIDRQEERLLNITTELKDMKSEYTGTIGVGTDRDGGAQFEAKVVFDTGSTNLWVASVLCQNPPCDTARAKEYYNPEKSVTQEVYVEDSEHAKDIDIMFGTGELKGPIHIDTYRVGPMEVKKQPFAMIREMMGNVFSSFPFEGILGLAFKSLSFGGITPFFDRVIEQKLLPSNEFAFYLNVDSSMPSALLWGGVDKELYQGPIRLFPVVQPHYWALELVDFGIGGVSLMEKDDTPRVTRLIVDSGTTYFTVPPFLYDKVVNQFPEAPCSEVNDYKPMTYTLRDVHGETYNMEVTQETYMIGSDATGCRPAFMQLAVNPKYGPAMILGEVFMRHFFTVFSRGDGSPDQARIGFARANIGAIPKVSSKQASITTELTQVRLGEDSEAIPTGAEHEQHRVMTVAEAEAESYQETHPGAEQVLQSVTAMGSIVGAQQQRRRLVEPHGYEAREVGANGDIAPATGVMRRHGAI